MNGHDEARERGEGREPGEDALARGLDRRAAQVFGTPVSMADVRRRARTIRRRRVAAATTAAAAAVAVVVLVPAALTRVGDDHDRRPQPAPSVPTSTATADARGATGQAAAVLHDGRLTLPGGSVVALPLDNADVSQLGVLRDGRVVVADQRTRAIEVYAADGSLDDRRPVSTLALTMSADGSLAAWVGADDRVEVLEAGRSQPVRMAPAPMPGEAVPLVDAVVGSGCADGGCSVLVGDGSSTLDELTVDRSLDVATPEQFRVDDISPDGRTWAVTFPPPGDQQFGCVGLFDTTTHRVTARTCETANLRFSPDGQALLGGFFENGSASEVQVLDRQLDVVRTYRPRDALVSRAGWSDAGHLLVATATLAGHGATPTWSLVSVPVDAGDGGDAGDAVVEQGPVPGRDPELLPEFLLSD